MVVDEAKEALARAAAEDWAGGDEPEAGAIVAGPTPSVRRAYWRVRSALLHELREKLRISWMSRARACTDADTGHDVFDSDDFLRMVRRLQSMRPDYMQDAEALVQEIADDDQSTVVNVVMEAAADLKSTLELWLVPGNLSQSRGIRRQIKNYVFFLRSKALRRLGSRARGWISLDDAEAARDAEPLLSWQGQRILLDQALSAFGPSAGMSRGSDRDSWSGESALDYRQIFDDTKTKVARMQSHAGENQRATKKRKRPMKDQLKKTRQRVNWTTSTVD